MRASQKIDGLRWAAKLVIALTCALVCFASVARSASKPADQQIAVAAPPASFAIGDFDGDNLVDIATVQGGESGARQTRYWIHFQLSGGARQFIPVTAPIGGVHIDPRDVNGDNLLDLIVTSLCEHRPVAVLLNDGRGHFTVHDPRSFSSSIQDAQDSWAPPLGNTLEIAAAMLPQSPTPDCRAAKAFVALVPQFLLIKPSAFRVGGFLTPRFVLGRAPPILQS